MKTTVQIQSDLTDRINWYRENINSDNITYNIVDNKLVVKGNIVIPETCEQLEYKIDELHGNIMTANSKNRTKGKLKSLTNFPDIVYGYVDISFNNKLTSLDGAPKEIKGYLKCNNCSLASADGISENVGGDVYLYNNPLKDISSLVEMNTNGYIDIDNTDVRIDNESYRILVCEQRIMPAL